MHQHVGHDLAQRLLVLGPVVEDRPAVEPDWVRHAARLAAPRPPRPARRRGTAPAGRTRTRCPSSSSVSSSGNSCDVAGDVAVKLAERLAAALRAPAAPAPRSRRERARAGRSSPAVGRSVALSLGHSRMSTKWPATAAAAAIAGDTRWVRPLKPWRPSKLRLRGRGAALLRPQLVGVHREAHRAARLAPLEAGGEEDLVEPLGLGLRLHQPGAGHHHGGDAVLDLVPGEHLGARRADPRCGRWCTSRGTRARSRCR